MNFLKTMLVAAAIVAAPSVASAASVSLSFYDGVGNLAAAQAEKDAFDFDISTGSEDFEGFPVGTATPLPTGIGTITTIAGGNPGGSAIAPLDQSVVRDSGNFGRFNTTDLGSNWLDSNDNSAMILDIDGTGNANRLSLFITDVDDVGGVAFEILAKAGGAAYTSLFSVFDDVGPDQLGNGNLILAMFDFGDFLASDYTIKLSIDDGDGFGIDDVNATVVPLPAGGLLLLTAVGGLAAFRRRKA